jgi:hypothetical protein
VGAGRLDEWVEDGVEVGERRVVVGAEHYLVGVTEVGDRRPFAQELGIHPDAEVVTEGLAARVGDQRCDAVCSRSGDDHALDDDCVAVLPRGEGFAQLFRPGLNDGAVDTPVLVRRRRETDEGEVGVADRVVVGGRAEPSGLVDVPCDESGETVLVDRRRAVVDRRDDGLVDVDVRHAVADVGETGRDGGADVAAAEDGDVHTPTVLSRIKSSRFQPTDT